MISVKTHFYFKLKVWVGDFFFFFLVINLNYYRKHISRFLLLNAKRQRFVYSVYPFAFCGPLMAPSISSRKSEFPCSQSDVSPAHTLKSNLQFDKSEKPQTTI